MAGSLYTRMRRVSDTSFLFFTARGKPRTKLGEERALKAYRRTLYSRDYDHDDDDDNRRYASRQDCEW